MPVPCGTASSAFMTAVETAAEVRRPGYPSGSAGVLVQQVQQASPSDITGTSAATAPDRPVRRGLEGNADRAGKRQNGRIFCTAATSADYALLSLSVRPSTVTFINCRRALGDVAGLADGGFGGCAAARPKVWWARPVARGHLDKIPAATGFWDNLATARLTAS